LDFLLTIDLDLAEFTVLTPFPGSKIHQQMEAEGRIFDRNWTHYNAATVVHRPRLMSPATLQQIYHDAWEAFYGTEAQHIKMARLFMDVMPDLIRTGNIPEHRRRTR
jgi:hypothetical protein